MFVLEFRFYFCLHITEFQCNKHVDSICVAYRRTIVRAAAVLSDKNEDYGDQKSGVNISLTYLSLRLLQSQEFIPRADN